MPGTLVITTLSDGTNSASSTNSIKGSANAWFSASTSSGGTPTILASYNIFSVTYAATGKFTVTFSNVLPSANYSVYVQCSQDGVLTYPNNQSVTNTNSVCGFATYTTAIAAYQPVTGYKYFFAAIGG